ncbi:hypothetical protein SAMN04487950_3327 [Halogranum rubrum]|uniref:DUF4064 domain-containing protein n=2 Tax=Halogranum rubrum TaxID=553466 RepID=A0A1I4GS47_9EURY|nr:hypothetical protein SAMN04487950_3327 [Halogranum rubrum]
MELPKSSLLNVARGAGVLACLSGGYGFLFMLGAFGPVSCWTTQTATESASGKSTTVVTRGCEAGIDYLFGSTGGNAPVLFGWAMVLIGLVAFGGAAAWLGYRHIIWATVAIGTSISILGMLSIGWFFVLPTLCLLIAAVALTVQARRESTGRRPTAI